MTDPRLDVLTIGNAIVDVIADTTDAFLEAEGLTKSSLRLIDAEEAERLYSHMGPAREVLVLGEMPTPVPGHGDLLIRIEASGPNPHDTKRRSGWLGPAMYAPRVIPHSDGAGVIAGIGAGVRGVREGE